MAIKSNTLIKFVLLVAIVIGIERFCHKQTEGFRLHKIVSSLSFDPRWEVPSLSEEEAKRVDEILSQKFTFLGSGGQAYAFLSEDKKTVLKLFKLHHLRSWSWLHKMPLPGPFAKYLCKREEKLPMFFTSCKIAMQDFRDRTGMIYLHLNKTSHLKRKLTLIDKLGITHKIDLDTTEFALQEKAELAYPRLKRLKAEGDIESAKQSIDSLLSLIVERCQRGIQDRDPNIRRNIGFLGNKAIEVDLGSFSREEFLKNSFAYKPILYYSSLDLKHFLEKHFPELIPYVDERVQEMLKG